MKNSLTYSLDTIDKVVVELSSLLPYCSVFTLTGDLGAGKTTLVKKILLYNGVKDLITSPSFNIVNCYDQKFYHFDLYRIKSDNEFILNGFHELLYQPNSWVFIEWPEILLNNNDILNTKICKINIEYINETERSLTYFILTNNSSKI